MALSAADGSRQVSGGATACFSKKLPYIPHRIAAGPLINDTRLLAVSSFESAADNCVNQVQILGFDARTGSFAELLSFPTAFPANSLTWCTTTSATSAGEMSSGSALSSTSAAAAPLPERHLLLAASDVVRVYDCTPAVSAVEKQTGSGGAGLLFGRGGTSGSFFGGEDSDLRNTEQLHSFVRELRHTHPHAGEYCAGITGVAVPRPVANDTTSSAADHAMDGAAAQPQSSSASQLYPEINANVANGNNDRLGGILSAFVAAGGGQTTFGGQTAATWSGNGRKNIAASCDVHGFVYLWDLDRGAALCQPIDFGMELSDLCFDPSGTVVAAAGPGQIGLYDLRTNKLLLLDPPKDSHAAAPGRLAWGHTFLACAWMGEGTQYGLCLYDPRRSVASGAFEEECDSVVAGDGVVDLTWMDNVPAPVIVAGMEKGECISAKINDDLSVEGGSGITWPLGDPATAVAVTIVPGLGSVAVLGAANEYIYIGQLLE